ncbi:MAG: sensor with HAMP domain protein [Leptolyngbyaceae cyanobacterium SL_7_1]|nr:sensor with HAMP domain protein [Leptolyngbyaceae cyanobacterium SL_7_1]
MGQPQSQINRLQFYLMTLLKKRGKPLSLRLVLIVPFVMQIFVAVGLVGYFSFRNGQQAISQLSLELQQEVNQRINQQLDTYLALPQQINQINSDAIELGLLDSSNLEANGRYFEKQVTLFQSIGYIGYILNTGEGAGAGRWLAGHDVVVNLDRAKRSQVYKTDRQTNQFQLIDTYDYDGLADDGYAETLRARRPIWTEIYFIEEVENYISVSASRPIYNAEGDAIGVISADLLLSTIDDFLSQIEISPTGRVFVMERDGLLLGSSTADRLVAVQNGEPQRVNVLFSEDPLNRAIAQHLQESFGSFTAIDRTQRMEFEFKGEPHFVQVMPWRDEFGLDWLVVTIIPEADFMGQINTNTRTTLLLCLATLAVATGIGLYTSHWITQPILKLIRASKAIAPEISISRWRQNGYENLTCLPKRLTAWQNNCRSHLLPWRRPTKH